MTSVGRPRRGLLEGGLTRRRLLDLVAVGAQRDPQRAADLRLVVDDQHPRPLMRRPPSQRQREHEARAADPALLDPELSAVRLDEPARDGQARGPSRRRGSGRARTAETRARGRPAARPGRGRRRSTRTASG